MFGRKIRSQLILFYITVAAATLLSSCVKNALVSTKDGTLNLNFSKQFGTSSADVIKSVSFSPVEVRTAGGCVATGDTTGSLFETNAGGSDIFVIRYDASGNTLWSRQFGASSVGSGGSGFDSVSAATYSNGSTFITGSTNGSLFDTNGGATDIFVIKLDSSGNTTWAKQLGASMGISTTYADNSNAITVDSNGDVYIAGSTRGNLGGTNNASLGTSDDIYLAKFNGSNGNLLWQKLVPYGGNQILKAITVDNRNSNVYVAGELNGGIINDSITGISDVFVFKFDNNGNVIWVTQFGDTFSGNKFHNWLDEKVWGIDLDTINNRVVIIGDTTGFLSGEPNGGNIDTFMASLDMNSGTTATAKQYGAVTSGAASSGADSPRRIIFNSGDSTLTIAGVTDGNFGGASVGGKDVFVMKTDLNFTPISYGHYGSSGDDVVFGFAIDSSGFMLMGGATNAGWFSWFYGGANDAFVYKTPGI